VITVAPRARRAGAGQVAQAVQVGDQIADRRRLAATVSTDRDQQLVPGMGQPGGLRLVIAPALKAAQGDAELEQSLEVPLAWLRGRHRVAFFRRGANAIV